MMRSPEIGKRNVKCRGIAAILVTLSIGVLFYVLNYYTPLYADDYSYSFSFLTGEKMTSISQIVSSQIGHYHRINGRSITHALAQVFILVGDDVFNYLNVFFFLALLYLIYFHACGSFKNFSVAKISVIAMLLFLSCPAFGQSFLWITGAANYLYGILIILCVLLPYRWQANGGGVVRPLWLEIIMASVYLLLGIIAGWTNENTSVAMIVMIIGYILLFYVKSIKIRAWNITGGIGCVIGCILMLLSPGTASRLSSVGGSGGIVSWIRRAIFYSCDMVINLQWMLLLFAVLVCMYIYQKSKELKKCSSQEIKAIFMESGVTFIYLVGFLASVYSMIVSPQFPGRAWSGPVVIFLVSIINLCSLVDMSGIKTKMGKCIAIVFLMLVCAATYMYAYLELRNIDAAYHARVSAIETAVASNEASVDLPNICGWSGYSCYTASGDLNSDSSQWPNTAIAKYYGIDFINCSD